MTTGDQGHGYPLEGLRVLEISTDIAGPYAGKLFADAGADVIKVEPAAGDPMRRHTASQTSITSDSALFCFLNAAKKSLVGQPTDRHVKQLAAAADIVIVDAATADDTLAEMAAASPAGVIVSITPFGRSGPLRDAPATEFTLQASCGSTGGRGVMTGTPLAAGGRLGEWVGGAFAAVVALAYARHARACGRGSTIDLSLLEAMTITMGGLTVVASQLHGATGAPSRSVELPSIAPTADGYVGFCTITAQQFQDFLVLIECFDWLDDPDIASLPGRLRRQEEFDAAVSRWTTVRTTAEIIEQASALRIPVAPIGTPDTVTTFDHFVDRGVFVDNPAGFVQPRVPYTITGRRLREPAAAPSVGEHQQEAWPATSASPEQPAGMSEALPLQGIRIFDLTAFWAGPSATWVLAALGADVIKVEGLRRPDGLRFAGARPPTTASWWETGSMFLAVNENKRDVTLELGTAEGNALARRLIGESDVVIENFSPRVMSNLGLDWETVADANPSALMVRMPAFGLDGPWRDRVGFAQTMEQVSGMAWLTGVADQPPVIPRGVCDPIAGLHATFATLVGLEVRSQSGAGALVEVPMVEAALNVAAQIVVEWSAYGARLTRDGNRGPVAAPQGVYRAAGDDNWVALAVTGDEQWEALCKIVNNPALDSLAMQTARDRRERADDIDSVIISWMSSRAAAQAVDLLHTAGVPAAVVTPSRNLLENAQLRSRGFLEVLNHPVAGFLALPAMPMRVIGSAAPWLRSPAPLLGQHNAECLGGLLGLDPASISTLEDNAIIGVRPAGL